MLSFPLPRWDTSDQLPSAVNAQDGEESNWSVVGTKGGNEPGKPLAGVTRDGRDLGRPALRAQAHRDFGESWGRVLREEHIIR